MLRCVLFDLDGTLFDTGEGIMRCIREALQESGVAVSDSSDLRRFVGPPFVSALREFYGMSEADALRVKDIYRRRYAADGIDECAPVPGARECLEALRAAGIVTAVATSKPLRFAMRILERFDFLRLFDFVSAGKCQFVDDTGTQIADLDLDDHLTHGSFIQLQIQNHIDVVFIFKCGSGFQIIYDNHCSIFPLLYE